MNEINALLINLISTLKRRNETLATAESCTGGMLGEWITRIPGASYVYLGGVISYADAVKVKSLQVPKTILEKYGAVSEQTAFYMAKGIQKNYHATWGISITGIAGPGGGSLEKPVGTVCFGIAGPKGILTQKITFKDLGRQKNREQAAIAALKWLRQKSG